jgi:tRNA uridine 5-carboxymethylaminomethyl modification enzyme
LIEKIYLISYVGDEKDRWIVSRGTNKWYKTCYCHSLFVSALFQGTTGYEEAGAQGILAGINAGLSALDRPGLTLSRAQSFIGVMVDDLITKGAEEPCEYSCSCSCSCFLRVS